MGSFILHKQVTERRVRALFHILEQFPLTDNKPRREPGAQLCAEGNRSETQQQLYSYGFYCVGIGCCHVSQHFKICVCLLTGEGLQLTITLI